MYSIKFKLVMILSFLPQQFLSWEHCWWHAKNLEQNKPSLDPMSSYNHYPISLLIGPSITSLCLYYLTTAGHPFFLVISFSSMSPKYFFPSSPLPLLVTPSHSPGLASLLLDLSLLMDMIHLFLHIFLDNPIYLMALNTMVYLWPPNEYT